MTDEREDLDALINSPGWVRFKQMVEQQWGTSEGGGVRFVTQMTNIAKADDASALPLMRQVIAAQREIHAVMNWPAEQAERLKRAEQKPVPDGQPLADFSRRGGL